MSNISKLMLQAASNVFDDGIIRGFAFETDNENASVDLTGIPIESGDTPVWFSMSSLDFDAGEFIQPSQPYVETSSADGFTQRTRISYSSHWVSVFTMGYGGGSDYLDGTETYVRESTTGNQYLGRFVSVMVPVFQGSWDFKSYDFKYDYEADPSLSAASGDLVVIASMIRGPFQDQLESSDIIFPSGYTDPTRGVFYMKDNTDYDVHIFFGYKISEGGTEQARIETLGSVGNENSCMIVYSPA